MKKLLALLMTVVLAATMFTACGSSKSGDDGDKTLIMGTNAEFPPYEYRENNEVIGIDAEIGKAIADKLGMDFKIEDMAFDSIIPAVQSGKVSMGLAGMTVSDERKESVDFTDSYATGVQAIIVKEGSKIKTNEDLLKKGANVKVGVQLGTTGDLDASDYEKDGSTVERYSKGSEAVQALKAGQIDCVIIDSQPAQKFVENNDDLKILDEPFEEEEYAICLKKGNDELLDKINGALKELKEDGTIDSIMDNYIGEDAGKTPYESPEDVDRSNGTLVMATNAEFEPYEYHEGDDIVGIDADIAQAICDKLGYELKIEDMEFDSILPAVQSGKADFGAAGMTVTEDRKSSVDFTDTYADASQVIIVKK